MIYKFLDSPNLNYTNYNFWIIIINIKIIINEKKQ